MKYKSVLVMFYLFLSSFETKLKKKGNMSVWVSLQQQKRVKPLDRKTILEMKTVALKKALRERHCSTTKLRKQDMQNILLKSLGFSKGAVLLSCCSF